MTLIEVLLALVLLGVLASVGLSWTTTTARLTQEHTTHLRWQRAAEALLRSIHADLAIGDLDPSRDLALSTRRVRIDDRTLSIGTRRFGSIRRVYRFDPSSGSIFSWRASPQSRVSADTPSAATVVLGDIEHFELIEDKSSLTLTIRIAGLDGNVLERTYHLGATP